MKKKSALLLGLIVLVLALASIYLLDGVIKKQLSNNLTKQYTQQETDNAKRVGDNLLNELSGAKDKLAIIATMPEVQNGSTAVCNLKVSEVSMLSTSKLNNLARVNKDGVFSCSVNKALIGIRGEKLGPYIPQIFNDPNHMLVMSRAIIPPGGIGYVVGIHTPVYDANKNFDGTLGAAIALKDIQEKYLSNVGFAKSGYIYLLDDNGDFLSHPHTDLVGKNLNSPDIKNKFSNINKIKNALENAKYGNSGTLSYALDGAEKVASYYPIEVAPGRNWIVFAAMPVTDAAASLKDVGVEKAFLYISATFLVTIILVAILLISNIMWSINQRQRLELERSRAQTLLSSIGDGIVAIDRDWKIALFNEAAASLTGWSIADALGKPLTEVLVLKREHDHIVDITFIEEAMLYKKTTHMAENTLLSRKDKTEIAIGDSAAPILTAGGQVSGAIIIFRNMTDEKEKQRVKSDFAFASHQLRTPLTQAMSALSLAEAETDMGEAKDDIKMAKLGMESLHKLIVKLLAMSDVESGRLILSPAIVDLNKMSQEVWEEVSSEQTKEITFVVDIDNAPHAGVLMTDPALLRYILVELLQNCVNYSNASSEVKLVGGAKDDQYLIEVESTGTVISEEEAPLIFTKFFRGSNKPSNVSGGGLGLYLVREYARSLGGKIWFSSKDGKTVFRISLPIK